MKAVGGLAFLGDLSVNDSIMKTLAFFLFLGLAQYVSAQSLPFDFESDITTDNFVDFDGGTATVIDNPQPSGINTSDKVAQIVRDGGTIWSGSKISLDANLDFSVNNSISMKVYTTAPVGTTIKFKLEGDGTTERDMVTTVSGEWEELTWDFTGEPMNFRDVVFMFDFGNVGDGSINSTFLFDDVQQGFSGFQIDWPTDFESDDINYTMTDFGGNDSRLTEDPTDPSNHVIEVIKRNGGATYAGTTIGTNAGFATVIPLTLTDSRMTVRVWSPTADTPIRLKVEDSDDPTHTCETETNTTVGGEWETIEFNFLNQAPGTELLSIGVERGWQFNMASIFFDFGTVATADEQTYYFDDVQFGGLVSSSDLVKQTSLEVFPNPAVDEWIISAEDDRIEQVELFSSNGELLKSFLSNKNQIVINAAHLESGNYFARIKTNSSMGLIKLSKL